MGGAVITICCVSTPAHRRLFQQNHELTRALNPGIPIRWEVVENVGLPIDRAIWKSRHRKQGGKATYRDYCAALGDGLAPTAPAPDRNVHAGYSIEEVAVALRHRHAGDPGIDELVERLVLTRDGLAGKLAGSYHHAFGLSRAIAAAGAGRFLVLLDPDFYVVRRGWIEDVLNHMTANRLAIFGAPWHPFWFNKFRGFPCAHFMVIDRSRVAIDPDDVIPVLLYDRRLPNDPVLREWARAGGGQPPGLDWLRRIATLPSLLAADFRQRRLIGSSRDTGYPIYARHAGRDRHECVMPVTGEVEATRLKPQVVSPLQLWLDRLYPRDRRYWPRDVALGARWGFAERGLPSVRRRGWEEFVWRGAPFAFHVRGQLLRAAGERPDAALLDSVLAAVLDGAVPARAA